jgi:peptidoglycan hydrolase-like protein with peptidoglycan-binding domain
MDVRRICALTAAAALAAPAPAVAGDSRVAALQVELRARGAYAGPVDGLAGARTTAAVRAAQREAGLVVDGIAGPLTRAALGARELGGRVLGRGDRGWDVTELQFVLAAHGFPPGTFDGDFGAHTEGAVLRFQRWAGVATDGRAGPETLGALAAAPPAAPIALSSPVDAPVGDRFGPRGVRFHSGLDYAAPAGTPVRAAAAGTVRWSGWLDGGYGIVVTVDHGGGVRTWYAHLERTDVVPGEPVAAGALVGRVGATGSATGPHLHFEVRVRGAAVDPLPAISG